MDSLVDSVRVRILATVALVAGALVLSALAGPAPADAAACRTATSTISKRENISCKQAKRVVRIVIRASGVYPECRGEVARARGWVARGLPKPGSRKGIKARFVKADKSFILSGGGTC